MNGCSEIAAATSARQRRVLGIALAINGAMFAGELAAGLLAGSSALLADAVDMLGDALVYGFSLYVVSRGPIWQARAALVKGTLMAAFGVGIAVEAAAKVVHGTVPAAEVMGAVGGLALAANLACFVLLWRSRGDDLNLRSAWLCSRNDVAASAGVLLAAAGVAMSGSAWPDIVVGLAIAAMFSASAIAVLRLAARELREPARR